MDTESSDEPSAAMTDTVANGALDLTSNRLLARNVAVNLVGWVLPAAVALFAVPSLTRGYGAERFGLLSLVWSLVGYFTLLDLGLGRAVTQLVAARLGRATPSELAAVAWTALTLLAAIAPLASVPLFVEAHALAARVLRTTADVQPDVAVAARVLAFAVPLAVVTSGLRGLLEAMQAFPIINALRIPIAVLTYAGPLVVLPFAPRDRLLTWAVIALGVGRALVTLAHAWAVFRTIPWMRSAPRWSARDARQLLSMGGWLSVSNLLAPVLIVADRFALANASAASVTGYYAAAQEVATKMWLFTGALFPVFFPAIALVWRSAPERASALADRSTRVVLGGLFPVALALVIGAPELLRAWLGAAFAAESAAPLQVLAIGLYVNCVATGPYTAIQAAGRPKITAVSHLAQIVPFAAALWWAAPRYGATGVATVVAVRLSVDAAVLWVALGRLMPAGRAASDRNAAYLVGAVLALVGGVRVGLTAAPSTRLALFGMLIAVHGAATLRWLVTPDEVGVLMRAYRARRARLAAS